MRTCWSNCRLRLSSYQSCLVRNTLLRQSSTFKPLLWHRPNLGHWPSGLLGSWTLQKFALLENLRRRRSGLCEQTQFFKLNILLSTRQDYVGIDFTIAVETFGETRIELLKPEGDSIPVTSENRFLFNVFIGSDSQSMPMIKSLGSSTSTLSLITSWTGRSRRNAALSGSHQDSGWLMCETLLMFI